MNPESTPAATPVRPVRPVAPYVGGKRNLAKRLVAMIEAVPHCLYAEPFVGMGGVFFRRRLRPKAEVINDWSREVSNLFRVLQVHYVPFLEMLRFQLTTRAEFERLSRVDPETLTDMQRAARFLYLQRTAFGGKVTGQAFGVDRNTAGAFDVTRLAPMLAEVHERLAGVVIERLPFADFLRRYDRQGALFYVDPPYIGSEHYYGRELFPPEDHLRLRDALAGLTGRFILSLNDCPAARELYDGFLVQDVSTTYGISKLGQLPAGELLISNLAA